MGNSKSEEFSLRDNRIAGYAKALSHPARVAILRFLMNQEACMCGDIVDELPLSQSTVSQHLKELKGAGLIKGETEGSKVCYCIDPDVWQEMSQSLGVFFTAYQNKNNQCC